MVRDYFKRAEEKFRQHEYGNALPSSPTLIANARLSSQWCAYLLLIRRQLSLGRRALH